MKLNKKIDFFIVCFLLAVSIWVWIYFNLKPLLGLALFPLVASFYLSIREKKNFKKIFWALLLFGGLAGFIFDFIETFNKAWIVDRLVFSWRIFSILPIDDIFGFLLMTLIMVIFYEHFLDDEKNKRISKNLLWALIPLCLFSAVTIFLYWFNPRFLEIPYVYLVGGITAIILPITFLICKPKLLLKFLMLTAFFFFVWFGVEIAVLKTGGWFFPGQYIGSVNVFSVTFPFEELFFWMFFYAGTITAFYELFIDDMK